MKKTEFGKAFLLILHNPRESEKTLLNNVGNIVWLFSSQFYSYFGNVKRFARKGEGGGEEGGKKSRQK